MSIRRYSVILVVVALAGAFALAGSETTRLPNGEILELMHPGVDGVVPPAIVEGTGVAPAYPDRADPFGEDSAVTVAVMVRDDGSVGHAEILSARHPGLGFEESALEAVLQWQYRPALAGEMPVHSYHVVRLNFRAPGVTRGANAGVLPNHAHRNETPTVLVRGQEVLSPSGAMLGATASGNRPASASWPITPTNPGSRTPTPINLNRPCMGGLCGSPTRANEFWSVQPGERSETPTPMPQVPTRGTPAPPRKK